MFSRSSNITINGGTLIDQSNRTVKGMDLLVEWVATGAFHDSGELYDAPKCHPHTRIAVLNDIMEWICESESTRDEFIMWFFGPAGAGKSAIAKRIAEIAAEKGLLIAAFFFSRTSPTRSTKDRLVPTLAYQLALSIPDTRTYIEDAIERDPAIFNKSIQTQIDTLLIEPFQSVSLAENIPCQKLIIIDGLDECNDNQAQIAILDTIARSFPKHKLPIVFLVVSRPEIDLVASFNSTNSIKSVHCRLSLDDKYRPDDDIRLFFSDKFKHIKLNHPLKSTIPIFWPSQESFETLVRKSSGQFIYAATVVRFVESNYHRPSARLNMILGISPPGKTNPFTELDALYNHIFSSVDDVQLTLHVLRLYVVTPSFAFYLLDRTSMSPDLFLSLEEGDIQMALISLSSIVSYDESSGEVTVLHASLVDFLCDKSRATMFYIDMARTCNDFFHRILQYVKGPDGIRAGDIKLFISQTQLHPLTLDDQLRSDILIFDLDLFITAVIRYHYKEPIFSRLLSRSLVIRTFETWMDTLARVGLDGDKEGARDQCNKIFELRLQKYQSDWRLQLLLGFSAVARDDTYKRVTSYGFVSCRCADILLDLDDHDLHLLDRDTLDLRHETSPFPRLNNILSPYVDGDHYAFAALHCMRFLSNPPTHADRNDAPAAVLIYAEWKATCDMALDILCGLLPKANTLPELVEFISDNDIEPAVQSSFSVDMHLLAFLSRANVCVNRRILSAIRRARATTDQPSQFKEQHIREIMRRPDQCCSNAHRYPS